MFHATCASVASACGVRVVRCELFRGSKIGPGAWVARLPPFFCCRVPWPESLFPEAIHRDVGVLLLYLSGFRDDLTVFCCIL